MKSFTLALAILLLPQVSLAGNNVCIHLNGGADEVYIGQMNVLEIWVENDNPLSGIQLSFEMSWHPTATLSWNMTNGIFPPVMTYGRAYGAFDVFFQVTHDFDNISADHVSIGGYAMMDLFPAGPSELCYTLEFMVSAPAGQPAGFCIQPCDYNTPPQSDWYFSDYTTYCPNFCGIPVADMDNPVAPQVCFDIAPPIRGDCDGNGVGGTVADFVYLSDYLFQNGPPPPDPASCDCDNYPGVNYGDIWQLVRHVEDPSYLLYDSPGDDYMTVSPKVKFLVVGLPDGETDTEAAIMCKEFRSSTTDTTEIECLLLVLTYAAHSPGEADLNCTGIDFTGSAATNITGNYDNDTKTLWIWNTDTPVMNAWDHWELVATAHFDLDPAGSPGSGIELIPGVSEARRPILLTNAGYADTDPLGERVSYVTVVPADILAAGYIGDVNCKDGADIDDVVYMIAYIFAGGPPPGDPDNDGVPDC